jgi:hypothetical protein
VDSMAEFIASAVEFLVGGIIFTIAVAFLLVGGSVPRLRGDEIDFLSGNAALVAAVFVAIAYAAGVAAESLARGIFEILLDRVTVRSPAFRVRDPLGGNTPGQSDHGLTRQWNRIHARALGRDYSARQCSLACEERERQRTEVLASSKVLLNNEVQGQLKRLRLERVCSLSLVIVAVALLGRRHWTYASLAGVSAAWMAWLVHTRFQRYCSAISRSYKRLTEESDRERSLRANDDGSISEREDGK